MRLDPEHVSKISSAFFADGNVKLDIGFMMSAMGRLNLWERGLFIESVARAVSSKKPSREQRVLLALFVHQTKGGDND